ncbi:hypothetical protein BY458DRAFT_514835 [Sporodiniella umbellata]|nr:hypothetical protein BY458DRAFT_514835 [Sporodiniella umbellata]
MEKYSRWRDAGTGIQPFLPPVPPRTDSSFLILLTNGVHTISGSVLAILKIPIVFLLSILYLLLVLVLGIVLTPIKPLKRAWENFFSTVLIRAVLLLMGFFYIKTETVSTRKNRNNIISRKPVKKGDIIVANWTSYVDILYLAYKFNPVFTQAYPETNKIKEISLWEALCSVKKIPTKNEGVITLKELSLKAKGPIVIFPEGATSNGRALLKFLPLFTEDISIELFHVMSFKYEYGYMSPTFTVGNPWIHLFKLCSQFHNTVNVRVLAKDEISLSQIPTGETLLNSLSQISKLRKTNLDMNDKREFLAYYQSRNKKKEA